MSQWELPSPNQNGNELHWVLLMWGFEKHRFYPLQIPNPCLESSKTPQIQSEVPPSCILRSSGAHQQISVSMIVVSVGIQKPIPCGYQGPTCSLFGYYMFFFFTVVTAAVRILFSGVKRGITFWFRSCVMDWMRVNKLILSPDKTKVPLVKRAAGLVMKRPPILDGVAIAVIWVREEILSFGNFGRNWASGRSSLSCAVLGSETQWCS